MNYKLKIIENIKILIFNYLIVPIYPFKFCAKLGNKVGTTY